MDLFEYEVEVADYTAAPGHETQETLVLQSDDGNVTITVKSTDPSGPLGAVRPDQRFKLVLMPID